MPATMKSGRRECAPAGPRQISPKSQTRRIVKVSQNISRRFGGWRLGVFVEFEWEMICERISSGMEAAKKCGVLAAS